LGVAALLSFNLWSDVLFFGLNIFDLLDTFTAKILLPLTGLGAVIFVAWCLERKGVEQELALSATGMNVWNIVARFVAPIGVIVVFLAGIL
jgi:NSS family neurotransmitter:Na+ symporter